MASENHRDRPVNHRLVDPESEQARNHLDRRVRLRPVQSASRVAQSRLVLLARLLQVPSAPRVAQSRLVLLVHPHPVPDGKNRRILLPPMVITHRAHQDRLLQIARIPTLGSPQTALALDHHRPVLPRLVAVALVESASPRRGQSTPAQPPTTVAFQAFKSAV